MVDVESPYVSDGANHSRISWLMWGSSHHLVTPLIATQTTMGIMNRGMCGGRLQKSRSITAVNVLNGIFRLHAGYRLSALFLVLNVNAVIEKNS